jgi:hypothetical protein
VNTNECQSTAKVGYTVGDLLSLVLRDEKSESEWLNHLSQLEYVGCRKILKAVPYESVDLETLQHIQEESSHALLLKQLAVELNPKVPTWTEGMYSALGWKYFSELDRQVSSLLPLEKAGLAYPLVSFIVEERVMLVYPAYRNATQHPRVKSVLNLILSQEGRHETRFERWVQRELSKDTISAAQAIESEKWNEFCANVQLVVTK